MLNLARSKRPAPTPQDEDDDGVNGMKEADRSPFVGLSGPSVLLMALKEG